jgi:hypothetical protein
MHQSFVNPRSYNRYISNISHMHALTFKTLCQWHEFTSTNRIVFFDSELCTCLKRSIYNTKSMHAYRKPWWLLR